MRGAWVVVSAVACGGQSSNQRIDKPPADPRPVHIERVARPAIEGLVLLDGKPVPFFGVTVTENFAVDIYGPPAAIHAKGGRFNVAVPHAGTWDVIIAGPGFARRVIPGNEVEPDKTLDLGDIVVRHGHVVQGTVRDDRGIAISGARVVLDASPAVGAQDELAGLMLGNIADTTDIDGHYRIEGVAKILLGVGSTHIVASTGDHRSSLPRDVPDADATIDLTASPTGTIEVIVTKLGDELLSARPVSNNRVILLGQRIDGAFRFDDLPVGDYDLMLEDFHSNTLVAQQRVSVSDGQLTSVVLSP